MKRLPEYLLILYALTATISIAISQVMMGLGALVVLVELAQHRLTAFASWGSFAYTQIDNLPLLQMAAFTGIAGITFLVSYAAATAEEALEEGRVTQRLALVGGLVVGAHALGHARMATPHGGGASSRSRPSRRTRISVTPTCLRETWSRGGMTP